MGSIACIEVVFPPADVKDGLLLAPRVKDLLERLWTAGRLASLLDSDEGRATVAAFETIRLDMERQFVEALGGGLETIGARIVLPESHARTIVVFARQLFALMADPGTMAAVGGDPLAPDEMMFLETLIRYAEAAVGGL